MPDSSTEIGEVTKHRIHGKGADELHEALINIPKPLVEVKEKKFTFRPEKDADNKPIILPDGSKKKRAPVALQVPIPTIDGIIAALHDDKQQPLVVSAVEELIYDAVRAQLAENPALANQTELDLSKLTLAYIANLPKTERRAGGIDQESWAGFADDFAAIMPTVTGLDKTKMSNAAKMFVSKLLPARGSKKALTVLNGYLQLWFTNSKEAASYQDVYEFLNTRIENWLSADEEALIGDIA